jgi:hypothetical protein
MPDETVTTQPVVETTTPPQPNGETQAAAADTTQAAPEFEAWLATQPETVKQAYAAHVAGLTSALDKERKANKKRDEAVARAAQEAENAKLGEVEKANKKALQLQQERDQLAQQVRLINARDALILAAEKQKVEFASAQAQRDALTIALQAAEFDEDGLLKNAEALLKEALKDRDYLIKKTTAAPAGDTNAAKRGETTGDAIDTARAEELARRFRIKRN